MEAPPSPLSSRANCGGGSREIRSQQILPGNVCLLMAHWLWDLFMAAQRTHIVLPQELIEEIDSIVGPRGRSAFLVETARAELRRRRLLSFLGDDQPAWNDKNHPELAAG